VVASRLESDCDQNAEFDGCRHHGGGVTRDYL